MSGLTTELVTTDGELAALRPQWEALWRRAPAATPFQSPAWLLSWWQEFGTGRPHVALLRSGDGRLCGLLPLYRLDQPAASKLLPMGVAITDYIDALLEPGLPGQAPARLLHAALAGGVAAGITDCDLTDLPPGAALRTAAAPSGWGEESWATDPCPVLALPPDLDGLRRVVPKGKRRDRSMALHRAAQIGGWTTEIAGPDSVGPLVETLVRLHQDRWIGRGEAGVLADRRVLAFHRAAAPALLACGALRLQALRFGARIAAIYYALLAGTDRILFYLSGFDAVHARESPGTILLGHMIEQAVHEGRRELHFLRGGEGYKRAWGGIDRMNATRRLRPGGG